MENRDCLSLQYVELAVLYKASVPLFRKFKMNGVAGPYVAYGLKGSYKIQILENGSVKETFIIPTQWNTNNKTDDLVMNKIDCGIVGGIGFEYGKLQLSLNYIHGVRPIPSNKSIMQNQSKFFHRVIDISFAYRILDL